MGQFISSSFPRTAGWLLLAGATVAAWAQPGTNDPPKLQPRRPNVILITADGLGYGDLGCYGQQRVKTPRIDAWAAGGTRFTEFHAGGATPELAQAALLGTREISSGASLASMLTQQGYQTGFVGYWGQGGFDSARAPQRQGFEVVVAYGDRPHAHDLYTGHLYRRDPLSGWEKAVALAGNPPGTQGVYLPDLLTESAIRFCRQNRPDRQNQFRPFFLALSYPVPAAVAAQSGPIPAPPGGVDESWPAIQRDKAAALARLDQHVGELLDELQSRGVLQNTLILLAGLTGPESGGAPDPSFLGSHGPFAAADQPLDEGRLRVPLIARWPLWSAEGRTSNLLVSGQDLVATVLEAAQAAPLEASAGVSFLPVLQGRDQTNRHERLEWAMTTGEGVVQEAVCSGRWKGLRQGPDLPWMLYDLEVDPGQATNVAGLHPAVARRLEEGADQDGAH